MPRISLVAAGTLFAMLSAFAIDASAASIRVKCEVRSNRAKISVDGRGLAAGTYTTEAMSGRNVAVSEAVSPVAGQIETDYDSDPGDIADGATPIPANFVIGGQVIGKILDSAGMTVVSDTVSCRVRR